jgi:xanthine dehydrogenase accessory factor
MTSPLAEARRRIEAEESVVVATVVDAPEGVGRRMLILLDGSTQGTLGSPILDEQALKDANEQLQSGNSRTIEYGPDDAKTLVFYDVYPAPDRLLIFGGVHIAVPLAELAKVLGFRVTVIDARGNFANTERFPNADEVVVAYADDYLQNARLDLSTYVVVLTHDPKLDDPAIIHALKRPVRYIGAIGSRRTHARRKERLLEAGLTEEQIATIHGPIGLNIGARNPEQIALSILAEMVAAKNGVSTLVREPRPSKAAVPV